MQRQSARTSKSQLSLPLFGVLGAVALALPSTGLAVVSFTDSIEASGFDVFTPTSVDPELNARVVDLSRERGFRFTPAGSRTTERDRTVTVAVRVDEQTAKAISVRSAAKAAPGAGSGIAALQASRFNLGSSRGYQTFTRQVKLPNTVRNLKLPDLADFEPSRPTAKREPSRLQPRFSVEEQRSAGRSPNTLDSLASQTVDVGGSFSLSPNLDVTAGVRLSQERDRLDPLTNSVQDSQAVYVGTQIKF
ncbi:MAG: hypothetical protein AAF687_02510 [Pseudomonadota bacterium]